MSELQTEPLATTATHLSDKCTDEAQDCNAEPTWHYPFGGPAYLDYAVERELGRCYRCDLPAGHTGDHAWKLDDDTPQETAR